MIYSNYEPKTCGNCRHRDDVKSWNAKICDRCDNESNWEEDAYPDLRQKMHDAVDNYDPQTEREGE